MTERPELSVALVGICGAGDIRRCLEALRAQVDVPKLEIVVAYDPILKDVHLVAQDHPEARFVVHEDERSPLQLASRCVRETTGKYVLLTEDHCVASPGWAKAMWDELRGSCGAVGGPVQIRDDAGPVDWAFYFVDFFRYARRVHVDEMPTLTVCNVAYRRDDLEALGVSWSPLFLETAVHDALKAGVGPLRLSDRAHVTMRRHVTLGSAVRERYVFGRLFGASRLKFSNGLDKWKFRLAAPVLPSLLFGRMAKTALEADELRGPFLKSVGPLSLMVMAWSVGEWLGYWTGTQPEDLTVAQEIDRVR